MVHQHNWAHNRKSVNGPLTVYNWWNSLTPKEKRITDLLKLITHHVVNIFSIHMYTVVQWFWPLLRKRRRKWMSFIMRFIWKMFSPFLSFSVRILLQSFNLVSLLLHLKICQNLLTRTIYSELGKLNGPYYVVFFIINCCFNTNIRPYFCIGRRVAGSTALLSIFWPSFLS